MDPEQSMDGDAQQRVWPGQLSWLIMLLIAAGVVGLIATITRERISRNEAAHVAKVIATVLPAGSYDNEPHLDRIFVLSPELLGSDAPLPVYRARKAGQPVAVVLTVVARNGYQGPIRMLVAMHADGRLEGVRVVEHEESSGLGDRIETSKSGWINMFAGRSLHDPLPAAWAVRRDGGAFDALTGATTTSRAVIAAVRDAVFFFEQNRERLFERPSE